MDPAARNSGRVAETEGWAAWTAEQPVGAAKLLAYVGMGFVLLGVIAALLVDVR